MNDPLFEYPNRLRDEETLYLLRAIAAVHGVPPFAEKDRRRETDWNYDGPVSEDPHAAVELVAADDDQWHEETDEATVEKKSRRRRFDWMKNDALIKAAEEARTGWATRAKTMKDPKAIANAISKSNEWRKYAGRRRKRIETEINGGRAVIVDDTLYAVENGVRLPWDALKFQTK